MPNNIILSVCIPTCNRPDEFRRCLGRFLPEITSEMEILIRDDSSNSKSENIAKKMLDSAGVNYRYYRGKKEGLDVANIFIAENAKGEFVWWFGDDDEILPGALNKVFKIIKEIPDISFLFVDFIVEGSKYPAVNMSEERLFKDASEFLEIVGVDMTLLSTGVFRRTDAIKGLPTARKYVGSHLASQPLLFEALTSGGKIYYLKGPFILNFPTKLAKGDNLFWDGVKTFGVRYFDILQEYKNRFSKKAFKRHLARNFGHIWRGLIIGWIIRDTEAPRKRIWELKRYWNLLEFWVALIIFLMPKTVVKILYKLYKKVFKRHYREII